MTAAESRGTVMIVDDTPANLALLSDALEEQGYRVLVATDGYSALEQLRYVKPDIILLDGMMPGIDGFETCRRIKGDDATRHIPVLFRTALGELEDLLRGFDEGAIDYIVKPFRNEEVLARVGAHLGQARLVGRTEQILAQSGLCALALDRRGDIAWLTAAAQALLAEHTGPGAPRLPPVLADFAMSYIGAPPQSAPARFQFDGLAARIAPCQYDDEYLVLLQRAPGELNPQALKDDLGLTNREAEVLMWIARGKTNRDIGAILGSSPRTVNKHLEHIFEKLGVTTRSAAVSAAIQTSGR